jgi:hypothetical protein
MRKMIDEIHDRGYQQARSKLNDGIDSAFSRFAAAVGTTFRVMKAINFSSPWAQPPRRVRRRAGQA